jgi:hypothetical protein
MRLLSPALAVPLLALATGAQAHPGHGASGPWHWHATDTLGFVMVAVVAGLAIWLSGRK